MQHIETNGATTNMFEVSKRGGYEPTQVDDYIRKIQKQNENLKKELEISLNVSTVQETEARLYDPDGAARKVLAAAQVAADSMITEAKNEAREAVAAYHEKHKAEIEAQSALYEKEKTDLSNKILVIKNLKNEIQTEIQEMVSGARAKMEAVHLASKELEEIVLNASQTETAVSSVAEAHPTTFADMPDPVPPRIHQAGEHNAESHFAQGHLEESGHFEVSNDAPNEQVAEYAAAEADVSPSSTQFETVVQEVMSGESIFEGSSHQPEPTQIFDPLVAGTESESRSFFNMRSTKRSQ